MDNSSCINLNLENIWESWRKFRKGKTISAELDELQYYLENNLYQLYLDLNSGQYSSRQRLTPNVTGSSSIRILETAPPSLSGTLAVVLI